MLRFRTVRLLSKRVTEVEAGHRRRGREVILWILEVFKLGILNYWFKELQAIF
jgi:hypothetical protein